jgi:hypothetical protein
MSEADLLEPRRPGCMQVSKNLSRGMGSDVERRQCRIHAGEGIQRRNSAGTRNGGEVVVDGLAVIWSRVTGR